MSIEIFGCSLPANREGRLNEDYFAFDEQKIYGIVADGVGGVDMPIFPQKGSQSAVKSISASIEKILAEENPDENSVMEKARAMFDEAHNAVLTERKKHSEARARDFRGVLCRPFSKINVPADEQQKINELVRKEHLVLRTTATSFFISSGNAYLTHIGDSKAYAFFKDGRFRQITENQPAATESLGSDEDIAFQVYKIPLSEINALALFTDGVDLNQSQLEGIVRNKNSKQAAYELVKKSSGSDDRTAIVMKIAGEKNVQTYNGLMQYYANIKNKIERAGKGIIIKTEISTDSGEVIEKYSMRTRHNAKVLDFVKQCIEKFAGGYYRGSGKKNS